MEYGCLNGPSMNSSISTNGWLNIVIVWRKSTVRLLLKIKLNHSLAFRPVMWSHSLIIQQPHFHSHWSNDFVIHRKGFLFSLTINTFSPQRSVMDTLRHRLPDKWESENEGDKGLFSAFVESKFHFWSAFLRFGGSLWPLTPPSNAINIHKLFPGRKRLEEGLLHGSLELGKSVCVLMCVLMCVCLC